MSLYAATPPADPAGDFTPAEIARNEALTTREKLDLLHRLKAELTGERADPGTLTFSIGDIDNAIEDVHRSALERRGFEEVVVHLESGGERIDLPHGLVADHSPDGRIEEIRVYFSTRPLTGHRTERPPLLAEDPQLREPPPVVEYERALATGDAAAVAAAFEADGYAREPDGAEAVHRGAAAVRAFYADQLAGGGIELERCVLVEDGNACALEYNAVQRGNGATTPRAGLTVYERGAGGKLGAVRIYDDLAPPGG